MPNPMPRQSHPTPFVAQPPSGLGQSVDDADDHLAEHDDREQGEPFGRRLRDPEAFREDVPPPHPTDERDGDRAGRPDRPQRQPRRRVLDRDADDDQHQDHRQPDEVRRADGRHLRVVLPAHDPPLVEQPHQKHRQQDREATPGLAVDRGLVRRTPT